MNIKNITHTCGHTTRESIEALDEQGQRWNWLSTQVPCRADYDRGAAAQAQRECVDCLQAAARRLVLEDARAWALAEGLPVLVGSERQIEWAETIRHHAMTRGAFPIKGRTVTSAKWWIDHR